MSRQTRPRPTAARFIDWLADADPAEVTTEEVVRHARELRGDSRTTAAPNDRVWWELTDKAHEALRTPAP